MFVKVKFRARYTLCPNFKVLSPPGEAITGNFIAIREKGRFPFPASEHTTRMGPEPLNSGPTQLVCSAYYSKSRIGGF